MSRRVVLDVNLAPPLTWRPGRPPLSPPLRSAPVFILDLSVHLRSSTLLALYKQKKMPNAEFACVHGQPPYDLFNYYDMSYFLFK